MKRREFIAAACAAPVVASLPAAAAAHGFCGPFTINGAQYCYAGLRSPLTHVPAAFVDGRHRVRWCWAACLEMVFRYRGLALDQARIVTARWGSIDSLPSRPAAVVGGLDGKWTDRTGHSFHVRGRQLAVSPVTAARVLANDMPLILVTPTHPVVLTTLRYAAMHGDNGRIQRASVHDPWPGRGRRLLSQSEWRHTTLLVDVQIG